MTDQDFQRTLAAASGYWPNTNLTENARKAWRHLLGHLPVDAVLNSLSDYAIEGHPFPPVAGQLRARLEPPQPRRESEADRCRRQRAKAAADVKAGRMSRKLFDQYDETYWSLHLVGKDAA